MMRLFLGGGGAKAGREGMARKTSARVRCWYCAGRCGQARAEHAAASVRRRAPLLVVGAPVGPRH